MTINISGILKSPQGTPVQNAEILFEQTRTSTEVLAGTNFSLITNQSGNYATTIGIGVFAFKVRFQHETQYRTVASNVIVTQAMNNYTLNQIIQDQAQLQDVDYDLLQTVLQARDQAAASAQSAQASQATASTKATEASSSAQAALTSKNQAQTSEANALASKGAAQTSQANASSSQTAAQSSQTTASTKAAEASSSAQAALSSKNAAATSEANALASKNAAQASQTTASTKAVEASQSQATASTKAGDASNSQDQAQDSQTDSATAAQAASTYQTNALASKNQAQSSQTTASTKASEASASAQAALASKNAAATSETSALASKNQAQASQTNASNSETAAASSQTTAATKAGEASTSQSAAAGSQTTATTKASEASVSQTSASGSQTTATTKAGEASASQASASGSQSTATTKASEASSSQALAQKWAANPENSQVSGGLYSALHYAAKAAQAAQTAVGQLVWRGGWSAQAGNPPPIPAGTTQDFYRITQQGTILSVQYEVGDYIHWDNLNSIWFKMDGTDSVISVNGKSGQVSLSKADIGLDLVNNWQQTSATNDSSTTKYATAGAVKQVFDLASDKLQLSGGTLRGSLTIQNSAPQLWFQETDNQDQKWAFVADGGGFRLNKNTTSVTDDTVVFRVLSSGELELNNPLARTQQQTSPNSLTRYDYVNSQIAQTGAGTGVGTNPNAITITGGVRDFNLAKTTGTYTVEGSWVNAVTNLGSGTQVTLAGILNVEQRSFDNLTIQHFRYFYNVNGMTTQREYTRTWNNSTDGWSPWFATGLWENVNTYRYGIIRHNATTGDDSVYPYVSYAKEKFRDTVQVGTAYTISEIGFRANTTNRYDPHSGDLMSRILGQVTNTSVANEYEGGLFLAARYRNGTTGLTSDTSTLQLNRTIGAEFTHAGKKVQFNAGNVTAESFYQNTAQDTQPNALTRKDWVDSVVRGTINSIINLNTTNNLDDIKSPGIYKNIFNTTAGIQGLNYPVPRAGNLVVLESAGVTQRYYVYNSSEVYSRAQYSSGPWTPWVRDYNEQFKPTAQEVGAVQASGGTYIANFRFRRVGTDSWPNTTPNSQDNYINQSQVSAIANNSGIHIFGDQRQNARRMAIQSQHADTGFSNVFGVLELNPYGGQVLVNGGEVYHVNNPPTAAAVGAINKSGDTLVNGGTINDYPNGSLNIIGANNGFYGGKNGAFLVQNAFYNGVSWAKHDNNKTSQVLLMRDGGPEFRSSQIGDTNPVVNIYKIYHEGYKPSYTDIGAAPGGFGLGQGPTQKIAQSEALAGFWRDSTIGTAGITIPYDGSPSQVFIGVSTSNTRLRFGKRIGDSSVPIGWIDVYSTNNKPTPQEIGAQPATSDRRLKTNIREFSSTVLDLIKDIKVYTYSMLDQPEVTKIGTMAQDWEQKQPETILDVPIGDSVYKGLDSLSLISLLLKQIQELDQKIEQLRSN